MGFFQNTSRKFRQFMNGRYGNDKLNIAILTVSMVLSVGSALTPFPLIKLILMLLCFVLLLAAIFRMLSRKVYKRYQENRKYLQWLEKMRDRQHRYYDCPRCRQQIRVPRGKGKISITCPKCKEKFIKKT